MINGRGKRRGEEETNIKEDGEEESEIKGTENLECKAKRIGK